jgi:tetratricopeptide (TPR) repeat protein
MTIRRRAAFWLVPSFLLAVSAANAQRLGPDAKRPRLAADADPNDAAAYIALGTRQIESSPNDAAAAFYWAARLDPSSADAMYGRAISLVMRKPVLVKLYFEGGRRARDNKELKAIDSMRMRADRLDPFLYRRFDRAFLLAYYRNIIRSDAGGASQADIDNYITDNLEALGSSTRAWLYYSQGRLPQALLEYDDAIRASKQPGYLRFDKARVYVMQGLVKPALDELTLALEALRTQDDDKKEKVVFYDSKAIAEHGIGILHLRLGQPDSARAAFGRAMTEDLSYFAAHVELGQLALSEGDSATATAELGLAAEVATDEPWVQYLYGSTLVATGNHADGIAPLRKAIELEPFYAAPHYALATALQRSGDAAGAKASYAEFLRLASRSDPQRAAATQALSTLDGALHQ